MGPGPYVKYHSKRLLQKMIFMKMLTILLTARITHGTEIKNKKILSVAKFLINIFQTKAHP